MHNDPARDLALLTNTLLNKPHLSTTHGILVEPLWSSIERLCQLAGSRDFAPVRPKP
jgi:hypothetical protein